jgi:hypothetical protein
VEDLFDVAFHRFLALSLLHERRHAVGEVSVRPVLGGKHRRFVRDDCLDFCGRRGLNSGERAVGVPEQDRIAVDSVGKGLDIPDFAVQHLVGARFCGGVETGPEPRALRDDSAISIELCDDWVPVLRRGHPAVQEEEWLAITVTLELNVDLSCGLCRLHTTIRSRAVGLSRSLSDWAV